MTDYHLKGRSPLSGFKTSQPGLALAEVEGFALVSMAFAPDKAFATKFSKRFGTKIPQPGDSLGIDKPPARFMGLARDQLFVWFEQTQAQSGLTFLQTAELPGAVFTDQADNWVALRISGEQVFAHLEKRCMIDLERLPVNGVARTVIEYLGVIILREGPEEFLLLSARSSAQSFLHILEPLPNI